MVKTSEQSYRDRVRAEYVKERLNNTRASQAILIARHEAKYGDDSDKHDVFDNRWGYPGSNVVTLPFGFSLKFEVKYDQDASTPWENGPDCGEGVITEWVHGYQDEAYGWILSDTGGFSHRYYDWRATLPYAVRDGWDAPPCGVGTARERAMRAMRANYEWYDGWCSEQWWYIDVIVTLYDPEGNEIDSDSCWGYDSRSMSYVCEEARSWAAHMLQKAHRRFFAERGDTWRQYELPLGDAA